MLRSTALFCALLASSTMAVPHFKRPTPAGATAAANDDFMPSMPGYTGDMPSNLFSGYLTPSPSKYVHYVFMESERDPANDPVVLWLNGGPGCSSLGGFFEENGPFLFDTTDFTKVDLRPIRWTQIANVLWLEAPVGVGFSYSTNPDQDYQCTDDTTANDNMLALEAFFLRYPQYANHKLFLTGESYAGVYVPTLAEAIMKATDAGTWNGANLTGIAVGNGCSGTDLGICGGGTQGTYYETKYLLGHAFWSDSFKQQINAACDWESAKHNGPLSAKCNALLNEGSDIIGNINIYDVFGDCVTGDSVALPPGHRINSKVPRKTHVIKYRGPNECIDSRAYSKYFSDESVTEAFHVHHLDYPFNVCGTPAGWGYTSTRANLPRDTYPALIRRYRVLIYNGDWDACVPYTDNEAWTDSMNLTASEPWHTWSYTSMSGATNQVGGYAVKYEVSEAQHDSWFRFITVRGGRHEVPTSAPDKALDMISRLINNTPF